MAVWLAVKPLQKGIWDITIYICIYITAAPRMFEGYAVASSSQCVIDTGETDGAVLIGQINGIVWKGTQAAWSEFQNLCPGCSFAVPLSVLHQGTATRRR